MIGGGTGGSQWTSRFIRAIENAGQTGLQRVPDPAIRDRDIVQVVRVDPFQAADVEAELFRIVTASVVRVGAAVFTEVMLGDMLAELIPRQRRFAPDHLQIRPGDCRDNGAFAFTE